MVLPLYLQLLRSGRFEWSSRTGDHLNAGEYSGSGGRTDAGASGL